MAPELRGHRSEIELNSQEVVTIRDACSFDRKDGVDRRRENGNLVLQGWGWIEVAGESAMQDDEIRDLFHRMELRLEQLDTKMDNIEKRVASMESRFESRFNSIDARLDGKAGNWVVSLWGATLAMLIAAAFALTKWL
jgi:hypothetical protein